MSFRRAALSLLLLASAALAQSARIQGVVNDDSGRPVPAVYAVATAQPPAGHATYSSVTTSAGEYDFHNLPPGKYSICVQAPGGPHLNNCQWSVATEVTVAAGQTLANQTISVTKGGLFQLRIEDPQSLITPTDDIFLVVYLPSGLFHPLRLASRDATSRTYDVAVPLRTPVRLAVISSHLQMADDKGHGLGPHSPPPNASAPTAATNSIITFPGQSGVNGPPITFTVTGRI